MATKMTQIAEMKATYKKLEDIKDEIWRGDMEEYMKFDNNRRYRFYHCESCAGPVIGHMDTRCRGLNGE